MKTAIILIFTLLIFAAPSWSQTKITDSKKTQSTVKSKTTKKKKKRKRKRRRRRRKKKKMSRAKKWLTKPVTFFDDTQRFISSYWVNLNHSMDMFFSDEKYERGLNKSRITASHDVYWKESEKEFQRFFDVSIRVHFPKVSKKLSIIIEKERDEIAEAQQNIATRGQSTRQNNYTAGVGYSLKNLAFFKTRLSTGIRFDLPLNPYAKLKLFNRWDYEYANIDIAQKFIYFRQDQLGTITQLSFSKSIASNLSWGQHNSLTWSDQNDTFNVRNSLGLNHTLNEDISMGYNIGANARLSPTYEYVSYDSSISYRQVLNKRRWLFGILNVGAEFQKTRDWKADPFFLLRFEVLFR